MVYYIRDPIHGFIEIDEWEKKIINQLAFQRLRRIKQLSLSNMVYPATNHTRFEHSLGVMHVATQMFDNIVTRERDFLMREFGYDEASLKRERTIVRLASLLHDVGHSPFSHAGEELMPIKTIKQDGKPEYYQHEDYSIAIIKNMFKECIDNDFKHNKLRITVDEICDLLDKKPSSSKKVFWRNLISGQLDADRADYLLRDSYYAGVNYGKYDLQRILRTLTVIKAPETEDLLIGIDCRGWHAAEGLIIARYQMFTQVYFQHTRRAYDHHITEAMKTLLKKEYGKGNFPKPDTKKNIQEYLNWDDWKVEGLIKMGEAGNHGEIILNRTHFRRVYETSEVPSIEELDEFESVYSTFRDEIGFTDCAEKSWYKTGDEDIPIVDENKTVKPLSLYSNLIKNFAPVRQMRIYAPYETKDNIKKEIDDFRRKKRHG